MIPAIFNTAPAAWDKETLAASELLHEEPVSGSDLLTVEVRRSGSSIAIIVCKEGLASKKKVVSVSAAADPLFTAFARALLRSGYIGTAGLSEIQALAGQLLVAGAGGGADRRAAITKASLSD